MAIVPDDKDWTWVLARPCPECGFEAAAFPRAQVGDLVRANAEEWVALRAEGGDRFRERPRDDRWSGLEYACHVRDVFRLYDHRLHLMLDHDDPEFPNWDQDVTAVEERYGEQDPDTVIADLVAAAGVLAASFDAVAADPTGALWERTGRRSDGKDFTVESFARYLVH
ncbi:MAG TPA: DinB family protein, partial [Acidimicrobiales bacterium]